MSYNQTNPELISRCSCGSTSISSTGFNILSLLPNRLNSLFNFFFLLSILADVRVFVFFFFFGSAVLKQQWEFN